MTQHNKEVGISNGPSKHDIMLALFDTDMGTRVAKFYQRRDESGIGGSWIYDVEIISARRCGTDANSWEIVGVTDAQGERTRVSIYYQSNNRQGIMRFEDELRMHGVMETPDDKKRAKALMIIIQRMVAIAQNHGGLPEEFYRLFEKAKPINWAEDRESLAEAIKDL